MSAIFFMQMFNTAGSVTYHA